MKAAKTLYVIILALLVLALASPAVPAYAQNPAPPSEADESWYPPEEGGEPLMQPGAESKSSSTYYQPPQPGTLPYIQGAYFIDQSGQNRTQFSGEPFYLLVQTNSAGYFYVAEYYTAESGRLPQWLVYRHYLDHAGTWTLGPYYAEPAEPAGKHTWKLWLYSSGQWARGTASFNYLSYYPPAPVPPVSGSDGWGPLQVMIVAVLAGALGITVGMLVVKNHRYGN
jgi:hypothetical protein